MIDRVQIDRVRQAIDLVELVREHVPSLARSGKTFKGLCPFHAERTPTFFVNPELSIFKCFGCAEGGDAIAFLMKIEHLTFWESVLALAQRAGIPVEVNRTSRGAARGDAQESERNRLLRVLAEAADFYHRALASPSGQEALHYLKKRGIKEETIQRFTLGHSPASDTAVLEHCLKIGFSIEDLEKAGVASKNRESGRFRDWMAGRLVFPIHDPFGHVVGFGGRILDEADRSPWSQGRKGPKYLNTPDTVLFKKGALLYGLAQGKAAMSRSGKATLVEGYMDVIACHQAGCDDTVAPLGTALTMDHAHLLKRYVREVALFFDADEAGWEATQRTFEMMMSLDVFVRIAAHPDGRDADEIIHEEGPEAWGRILEEAEEGIDHLLEMRLKKRNPSTLLERIQIAEDLLRQVARSPNDILKSEWLSKISRRLSLDPAGLAKQLSKQEKNIHKVEKASPEPSRFIPSVEGEVIQILLSRSSLQESCGISPSDFVDPRAAEIMEKMIQVRRSGSVSGPGLIEVLSPAAQEYFSSLAFQEKTFEDVDAYLSGAVKRIKLMKMEKEIQELKGKIQETSQSHERRVAMDRYRELLNLRNEMQRLERQEVPL